MNPLFLFRKEMTPIRKLLMMKAVAGGIPISEYTATGNPLSFNTNIVKPLKSLVLPWTPTQSGTGDPSPENVRPISGVSALNVWQTGKNLFDGTYIKGYINSTTFVTGPSREERTAIIPCSPNTKYTIKKFESTDRFQIATTSVYPVNGISISGYVDKGSVSSWAYTTGADAKYIIVYVSTGVQRAEPDMMVVLGETEPTTYSPYHGNTYPVTFPALGKNLLDPATLEQGGIAENGTETVNSARVRTGYIPVESGKRYTVSATGFTCFMHFYTANKESIGQNSGAVDKTAPENCAFVRCFFRNAGSTDITPSDITEPMFEQSSSVTAYEPYTNTVYGGTLDVTTGVLTVEWECTDMGSLSWHTSTSYANPFFFIGLPDRIKGSGIGSNYFCDIYKQNLVNTNGSSFGANASNCDIAFSSDNNSVQIYVRNDSYSTAQEFITAMSGKYVVYKIATPVTYQLTPQQITALLGDNTIWSDTNGSNTAIYLKKG